MTEVIRLLRFSLILRIAIAILIAFMVGMVSSDNFVISLVVTLPSFVLLALTFIGPARGWTSSRFVNGMLAATIVAQTMEEVAMRLLLRANVFSTPDAADLPLPRGPRSPVELLVSRGLFGGALLTAVPAVLGAWLSGKRGALPWAAFAAGVTAVGELITAFPNVSAIRFITGPVVAQGVAVAVLAYFVGSLADQQRAEQRQLEQANRQLGEQARVREQLAASRERMRLSRDLHDTLAHTLAGLIVQLKAIGTLLDKQPEAAKREILKAEGAARQGLDDTRAAIGDLRANMVRDLGLSGALQRQVQTMNERGSTRTSFQLVGDEPALSDIEAEGLFRIAQEALNNVQRHAGASQASVTLESSPSAADPELRRVTISVMDDGVGFDASTLDDSRFGLRGMRERAEELGAHLRVDSAAGRGTAVSVTLNGKA
jgi:signal transduction histidine kinase